MSTKNKIIFAIQLISGIIAIFLGFKVLHTSVSELEKIFISIALPIVIYRLILIFKTDFPDNTPEEYRDRIPDKFPWPWRSNRRNKK